MNESTADAVAAKPPRNARPRPGTAPGLDAQQLLLTPSGPGCTYVNCVDYSEEEFCSVDIIDCGDFLESHRPEWSKVRWINVDGLSDTRVLSALVEKYELHPLAVEDMFRLGARPKAEFYPGDATHLPRLFIVARMISLQGEKVKCEQISFFLGRHTLLTFQEDRDDIWDLVRDRITREGSAIRLHDASYLVYALLDAIVDHCFPVLEQLGDRVEKLEEELLEKPTPAIFRQIQKLKHEILVLRREVGPMRELISSLLRSDQNNISEIARLGLRDVHDHSVQVIELLETYRDLAAGLSETYLNAINFRLTQVMKVLTIISTMFMPLSFLAGVYGMNFQNMPEITNHWAFPWSYPIGFWSLVLVTVSIMLYVFRRNRWL